MSKGKILIVEDDGDIREGVRILLESEEYEVIEARDGEEGLDMLDETVDLVILDIMMPKLNGLKVCEQIRRTSNVPVLFLTAKSQESDKLLGLMVGGDDYLAKPFSYAELLGRVKALLRIYQVYQGKGVAEDVKEEVIEIGTVKINTAFNEIVANGKNVEVSDLEYKMLRLMMQHPRKIFSAQNLYESVWREPYFYTCGNTVMVHIRKLRTKIEPDPQKPQYIRTVWGKGYRFDDSTDTQKAEG